jgi:cytochrome c5
MIILLFAASAFLISCSSIKTSTEKSSEKTEKTTENAAKSLSVATSEKTAQAILDEGKTIYANSCTKCHELPETSKYTAEKWTEIMKWMAPKAKLTDEQSKLVYNYVTFRR